MMRTLAVILLAIAIVFGAAAGTAYAAVATFHDGFSTLNPVNWQARFFPANGSADATQGFVRLRPTGWNSTSDLESVSQLVTNLPAHVSFTLRLPTKSYRNVNVVLSAGAADGSFGFSNPYILWNLGTTTGGSAYAPGISERPVSAPLKADQLDTGPALPTDTWIRGELWLTSESIDASCNGSTLHISCDPRPLLSQGGLRLSLATKADASGGGLDVDDVAVDSARPPSAHIRGKVTDMVTGSPIAGVHVGAWYESDDPSRTFDLAASAVTSPDGSYELLPSDSGEYAITFDDPTGTYRDQTFANIGLPLAWAPTIPAEVGGAVVSGVNAALAPKTVLLEHKADRVYGKDRYWTAIQISRSNFATASTVVITTGSGFADACAASPLCGYYRAPLLLTLKTQLAPGVADELSRLKATQIIIVGSEKSVSPDVVLQLEALGLTVRRIGGIDRWETSARIVEHLIDEGADLAPEPFVVRGDLFPDALSVAPFAYQQIRPVILTRSGDLPSAAARVMRELGTDTVIIVGGPKSVGSGALNGLAGSTPAGLVYYEQIYGDDRHETAAALAEAWGWPYDFLAIAKGTDFPDALAGGIAAGERFGALLLTPPSGLAPSAHDVIVENAKYLWPMQVFGGPQSVYDKTLTAIRSARGSSFFEFEGVQAASLSSAKGAKRSQDASRSHTALPRTPMNTFVAR